MGQGSVKRAAFSRDSGGEAKVWMAVKTTRPMGGSQCGLVPLQTEGAGRGERTRAAFSDMKGFEPSVCLLSWQVC